MRKLKLLSLLMLICFSVGNVFADSFTITLKSGTGTSDSSSGMTSTNVSDYVADGADFVSAVAATGKVYLAKSDCGIKFGNSSGGGSLTFTLTNAVSPTSIVVNASQFGASEGKGIFQGQEFDMTGGGGKYVFNDYTVNYDGNTEVTTISVGAEKRGYVKSITVNYGEGEPKTLSSIAISGTPTKTAYYVGDEFDPAGLVVTGTYSDQSQSTITSGITWSYDPSQTLALNQTSIGVTATVGNISSEEYNVDVTVTEAPAADNYEKVTAAPNDWSGEYLLVYEDGTTAHVWTGVDAANCYAAATISNDVIAKPEGAATLTIAPVEAGGYSLMINGGANDGKYLTDNANNTALKFATEAYGATFSYESDWTKILFSQRCIRFNNGTNSGMRFRYYADNSQQPVQLYKKVEGAILPAAGLEYAAADQKKLTKLGDEFTAPTLINPNQLTVSYASNNTDVAEVAANGAVTIKAAGVAVITASFESDGSHKSGSASYTLGVTNHAGTEADPFDVADTKIAIDALESMENAYATGIVSNVQTTTLPAEGYLTFFFSADGTTTEQIEAYRCFGLNSAPFEAVGDVVTGATVVVTGTLKKYNSTYEFDQNCHLVSYTALAAPKQSIANDQANPYTVAQAITFAANPVTYDLDDFVYVQGVVDDVKNFNNGAMNIFIKDANAENQFELYKCAGINDGNETTAFTGLDDVQSTNIVIAYGQLTVFNTTYEFKQGNYLVDLQAPVTAVEMAVSEEVEVGSTVTLTAHVMPSNADQSLTWSVEDGGQYASVDQNGVVTGLIEGTAVIRAACADVPTLYSECTVTVNPAAAPLTDYYQKVTSTDNIVDGTYLIVYEDGSLAFDGGLDALDVASNTIPVTIVGGDKIAVTEATAAATFFFDVTAGTIQAANGKYIGVSSNSNGLKEAEDANTYFNTFAIDADGNAVITASFDASTMSLRYNKGSNQTRFRYYANAGQQPIALYKLANEVVKQDPGISWDTESAELTLNGDITPMDYPKPELLIQADLGDNPLDFITLSSDNESLATINKTNDGQINISWVPNATGIVHFTAAFPGNDTYKAVNAVCMVTIKPEPAPASIDNVVILASFNNKLYAMSNELSSGSFTAIEVEEDGANIVVPSAEAKTAIQWTKDFNGTVATFADADGKYLAHNGTGTNLMLADDPEDWTLETTAGYFYTLTGRTFFYNDGGVFKNYSVSNFDGDHYSGVSEIRVIDPENIVVTTKVDPELAFTPTSVILTVGDDFVAPTLSYADNFDGLAEVTLESSNPDLATVEGGVVSLVADATGTATITASFPGNANYKSGNASYTITVNEAGDDLSGTWTRVTAVAAGQKIIIAGTYNEKTMAMGKQNSNNRAAVLSTLDGDVLTPGATTNVFTLVDAGEGLFAIQASNGKYLNAAGTGSSNYLREADDFEAASAKWTITFDENGANIVATSTGNRNVIRYNSSNNSELFSCYAEGGQRAINIYSNSAAPEPPVEDWTDVRTGLTSDHYYTICLEKEMTNINGATLWSFIGKDDNYAYLVKEEAPFEAGKPYIMHTTASTVQAVLTGDDAENAGSNNGLYGTFSYMDAGALSAAGADYMLYENALHPIGTNNHLDANRAYVILNNIQGGTPGQMPGRQIRRMPMQPAVATGFENVEASENPMKLMINGQMYILRGEKLYDATGRLVK